MITTFRGGQRYQPCPPLDVKHKRIGTIILLMERVLFMADIIAVIVLVVLIGSSVTYIVKAKKSGVKCIGCPAGGSCPGSARTPKKKLEGRVIGRKTMKISGMHCAHCAADVTKILNQINGVRAEVNLSKGSARISYDREIGEDILKNAVEKAGYHVTQIC